MSETEWIVLAVGIIFCGLCLMFARAGDDDT